MRPWRWSGAASCLGLAASSGVDVVEVLDSNELVRPVGTFPGARRYRFRQEAQVDALDGEPDA
jgi:hypothetical protein